MSFTPNLDTGDPVVIVNAANESSVAPMRMPTKDRLRMSSRSSIGCAVCHMPTLVTGPNAVGALDGVEYHPYSDFLLHDMGSLGDGIVQGAAGAKQMRTAPLWGLRVATSLLHDGRAETPLEAILAHDGQGRRARDCFKALDSRDRQALLAFLDSDRKSTRLNSSHQSTSRMPSSA